MSTQIAVSLISAVVALVSIYLSTRASRRTAKLTFDLTKEQKVEEVMSRYREPLVRAAFDLQSRIYNIIRQGFLSRYGAKGREHEREYARDNTLFLFGEYFGWVEILRRDVQFLDLGDVERNRRLVARLDSVGDTFASDRKISDRTFRVFKGEQRALGELMSPTDPAVKGEPRTLCIGYAAFRARLRDDRDFAHWFGPLREDVEALIEGGDPSYERLTKLQHALVDLIDFLDDPPTRFLAEYRSKL